MGLRAVRAPREPGGDDPVPYADYSAAIHATLDCVRAAGVPVTGPGPDISGLLLEYLFAYDPDDEQLVTAIHDRCYEEHAAEIDAAYQIWVAPQRADVEAAIFDCVEANGVPSPRTETQGEAAQTDIEAPRPVPSPVHPKPASPAAVACIERARRRARRNRPFRANAKSIRGTRNLGSASA